MISKKMSFYVLSKFKEQNTKLLLFDNLHMA